jgi:tetratricopeptide (TPR) repeat protein
VKFHNLTTLLLLPVLLWHVAPAQTDSLNQLLAKATHDTARCRLLNRLIESEMDESVWPKYNEQLLQIAEKHLGDKDPLQKEFLRYKAYGLNNLGYIANMKGDNDQAIQYYGQALKIQEKIGDRHGMAGVLYNMGDLRALQGDIHGALENLHLSLKLHQEVKDERGTAYVLNDLGWHYHVQGDEQNAMRYLEQALELRKKLDDVRGLANTHNNLGLICLERGQLEKARTYFSEALKLMKSSGDARGEGLALNNLGNVLHSQHKFSEALEYYRQSAAIQQKNNDKDGWLTATANMAQVMHDGANGNRAQLHAALQLGLKAMQAAREVGLPTELRHTSRVLYQVYQSLGDYKNAFNYYALHIQMRDSVSNQQTRKTALKRQLQFEYDKKTAADSIRNQEAKKVTDAQLAAQQAQLTKEKTQRYALYGGLALVAVFLVFLLNRFALIRRQKAIIEEQKKIVDHAYESLHEKNKEVLDSIQYARRIQKALITSEKYVERQLERLRPRR